MTWRTDLARRMADHALRIAPDSRREWLRAMQAELPYIPANRRIGFAAGTLWVACIERSIQMKHLAVRPVELIIMLGAAFLALVAAINGLRLFGDHVTVAASLWGMSVVWIGVLAALLFENRRLLARIACFGIALSLAIAMLSLLPQPAFAENIRFLRALALEGVMLFGALIALSATLLKPADPAP